jgi:hypothetical protein
MYSRLKVRTLIETKHFMMFELVGRAIWVERPDLLFRALWSLAEKKLFVARVANLSIKPQNFLVPPQKFRISLGPFSS